MAKRNLRFPLEMKDGALVRTYEEFRENFSLKNVLLYIDDGRLEKWLRNCNMNDMADEISELDKDDADFNKKLCAILEVEYSAAEDAELKRTAEINRRLHILMGYTDNEEFLQAVEQTAFEQDEIYSLLDEGITTIYLCGDEFFIPLDRNGITYIGVSDTTVVIDSKEPVDWEKKEITLIGVNYDEKYMAIDDGSIGRKIKRSPYGEYKPSEVNFMLSPQDKKASRNLYEKLSKQLRGVYYDIDRDIRDLRETLVNEGVPGMAKSFLENL